MSGRRASIDVRDLELTVETVLADGFVLASPIPGEVKRKPISTPVYRESVARNNGKHGSLCLKFHRAILGFLALGAS